MRFSLSFASADNFDLGLDKSWYHAKAEFNNCFIIQFRNSCECRRRRHYSPGRVQTIFNVVAGGVTFIIYIPGARGIRWTESPERRVYKWYIIPKIKNFHKNTLLSSSSWTYLREYDALKYKIASPLFIFITRIPFNFLNICGFNVLALQNTLYFFVKFIKLFENLPICQWICACVYKRCHDSVRYLLYLTLKVRFSGISL